MKHRAAYLLVACALGPLYEWTIVSAASLLPWTKTWEIDMFTGDPVKHVIPFTLACTSLAWGFRHRVAHGTSRTFLSSAVWCSLLGGPVYLIFAQIQSLFLVPGQLTEGIGGVLELILLVPLAGVVLGGAFGALFLPVTVPLTWGALWLLRMTSGGRRRVVSP